jgi:hypothetical protein
MENIQSTFPHIPRGFESDQQRSKTPKLDLTEVFDYFTKITNRFTFMLADSSMATSSTILEPLDGCPISQWLRLTVLHLWFSTRERLLQDLRHNQTGQFIFAG